jgi:hypothetical protein
MTEIIEKKESNQNQDQMKAIWSLLFTIVIPTLILNKASKFIPYHGPLMTLIIALLFPLSYGIYDHLKTKKNSILAIIGIVNILFTGGFALLKLHGFWFAVKEAAVPLIIGLGIIASAFTKKPLIQLFIMNDSIMNVDVIEAKLQENQCEKEFRQLLRTSTIYLGCSFFLSSLLNFLLARHIFTELTP